MNDEDEEFEDALDTLEQTSLTSLTVGEKAQPQVHIILFMNVIFYIFSLR